MKSFAFYKSSDLCQLIIGSKHCLNPWLDSTVVWRLGLLLPFSFYFCLQKHRTSTVYTNCNMVEEMWRYVRSGQRCLCSWTAAVKWANTVQSVPRKNDVISFAFERQDPDKFTANGIIKIQHLHMTSALLVHYDVYLCWWIQMRA